MVDLDEIISEKYYAVNLELAYSNFEDWNSLPDAKIFLIVKEIYGYWKNFQYNNHTYRYELFDGSGKSLTKIFEGSWRIDHLRVVGHDYGVHVEFRIVDPSGTIWDKSFGKGISSIIDAIKFLREICRYQSLEQYNLITQNSQLKEEYERVNAENATLKSFLNEQLEN